MRMSDQSESDDVLESLHEGPESHSKLMLAVIRRIMAHQDRKTTLSLNFKKFLLEPSKLMAWVVALSPDVEIEHIAAVRVVCDNFGTCGKALAILEFQVHGVEAVLAILFQGLFIEPLGPECLDVVDGVVGVGCREVLLVNGPGVMVAVNWKYCNVRVLDSILNDVRDRFCVASNLLNGVRPDVM